MSPVGYGPLYLAYVMSKTRTFTLSSPTLNISFSKNKTVKNVRT